VPTHEEQMVVAMREHHDKWVASRTTAQAEAAQADKPDEALKEGGEEKAAPVTLKAAYVGKGNVVYCIGAYAGNEDKDLDTLHIPPLVQMAHDFVKASKREFNANHGTANKGAPIDAELVESMTGAPILKSGRVLVYGDEMPDPKDDPVTGIDLKGDPIAWFCALEINDPEIVELVKSGAIIGTSWEAYVRREDH
jgi:hypothetical protein